MKQQINRKAILLSAFFTALALTLTVGGYFLSQNWSTVVAAAEVNTVDSVDGAVLDVAPRIEVAPAPLIEDQAAQPITEDPAIAAYQAQLEAAYTALNEAYAQIETLQTAQTTTTTPHWDDDDAYEGHGEHEEREHEGRILGVFEREHDDD
ncbi:MAG: hypothetical protein R2873_29490 [Caldilineaceae bacterium]|nr:hypothetical protein [Caldilineaceae bacterium]